MIRQRLAGLILMPVMPVWAAPADAFSEADPATVDDIDRTGPAGPAWRGNGKLSFPWPAIVSTGVVIPA